MGIAVVYVQMVLFGNKSEVGPKHVLHKQTERAHPDCWLLRCAPLCAPQIVALQDSAYANCLLRHQAV